MKTLLALLLAATLGMSALHTPGKHARPESQTFLTGPEWFLVFSPEEYSDHLARGGSPGRFPFYAHIGQFWQGYAAITGEAARYQTNYGYHLMIVVIGLSTTVEYGFKGLYETFVGRFSEAVAGGADTEEDKLAAGTASDYVAFIKQHAWFDFDFMTPLRKVWSDCGWWGDHPLRKWERKYMLTTEYLLKAGYGWLLARGSHATYGAVIERTYAVVDNYRGVMKDAVVEQRAGDASLVGFPRYQDFTGIAQRLAAEGADFEEIAGNRDAIMITAVGRSPPPGPGRILYAQPVLTVPGETRYAIVSRVGDLAAALRGLASAQLRVEHVYDY